MAGTRPQPPNPGTRSSVARTQEREAPDVCFAWGHLKTRGCLQDSYATFSQARSQLRKSLAFPMSSCFRSPDSVLQPCHPWEFVPQTQNLTSTTHSLKAISFSLRPIESKGHGVPVGDSDGFSESDLRAGAAESLFGGGGGVMVRAWPGE